MRMSLGIIMAVLGYILWIIVEKGYPALSWSMITQIPSGGFYLGKDGGILNAIAGSLIVVSGSVILSLAIGLPITLYINFILQRNSRTSQWVRFAFDILFGIPSIVYGAFGFLVMMYLGIQASVLGGVIAVTLLVMPIMVRSIDEVASQLPTDLTEVPLSLGATRWEMVQVVVRKLMPGISTAILLSVGRGIGDAATVLFTAGYTDNIPVSPGQPAATLPLAIFFQLSSPIEEVQNRAYAAALILTAIILILSFSARYFSRKLTQ